MIGRRAFLKGLVAGTAGLLLPSPLVTDAEDIATTMDAVRRRRLWALDRTMIPRGSSLTLWSPDGNRSWRVPVDPDDATPGFRRALASLPNGGTVLVPSGRFVIRETILVNVPTEIRCGQGPEPTEFVVRRDFRLRPGMWATDTVRIYEWRGNRADGIRVRTDGMVRLENIVVFGQGGSIWVNPYAERMG